MPQRLLAADSGPLIALARLHLLNVPADLFDEVLVTDSVWAEVTAVPARAEHASLREAQRQRWLIQVADPPPQSDDLSGSRLDMGERTVLALASQLGCAVLMDERLGRNLARAAGLNVLGTLGLLVRAKQLGNLQVVRPLVQQLVDSGYHLAPALIAHAMSAAGE